MGVVFKVNLHAPYIDAFNAFFSGVQNSLNGLLFIGKPEALTVGVNRPRPSYSFLAYAASRLHQTNGAEELGWNAVLIAAALDKGFAALHRATKANQENKSKKHVGPRLFTMLNSGATSVPVLVFRAGLRQLVKF